MEYDPVLNRIADALGRIACVLEAQHRWTIRQYDYLQERHKAATDAEMPALEDHYQYLLERFMLVHPWVPAIKDQEVSSAS